MGLLSIFQRKSRERLQAPAPDASPDAVQEARTRARRRLIGASVLVVIGVVGFPILFETQPRPIPVDIPIEIPRKDSAPALAMPAAKPAKPAATARVEPAAASAAASEIVTETQADAGREVPLPKIASAPVKVAEAPAKEPPKADKAPVKAEEPARSDKEPAKKNAGRFVVQVGAFADASAARETRQKVEKLGLKTYTQVAETTAGNRIRVRVGPFASRDEADRVLAKLKAAGAQAVVLTL
jgi:DedD protein